MEYGYYYISAWKLCDYTDKSSAPKCNTINPMELFTGNHRNLFQSYRAFGVLAVVFVLVFAVLATVRHFYYLRRQLPLPRFYDAASLGVATVAIIWYCISIASVVSLYRNFDDASMMINGQQIDWLRVDGYLNAFTWPMWSAGAAVIGLVIHVLGLRVLKRVNSQSQLQYNAELMQSLQDLPSSDMYRAPFNQ